MIYKILGASLLALVLNVDGASAQKATCTDGPIVGGVWTGIKDDPGTPEDETNQVQYIDMNIDQGDGRICVLSLEYIAAENKFYITDLPLDPTKENTLTRIKSGEFKILDNGVINVVFEDENGKVYEETFTED